MNFINPYNFVPLADKQPSRTKSDKGDLSGYIEYDLLTKTPLFIPNTSNMDTFDVPGKVKGHKSFEFFSYQDLTGKTLKMDSLGPEAPVIPGSEIRGMFRSNYEILTNSCLSIVDDDRDVVLAKRTNEVFKPGLIKKEADNIFSLYEAEDCLMRTEGANSLKDITGFDTNKDWTKKSYIQDSIPEGTKVSFERKERNDKTKPLARKVRIFDSERDQDQNREIGYIIKGEAGPETHSKQEKHCCHVFKSKEKIVSSKLKVKVLETALDEYKKNSDSYSEYSREWKNFKKNAEPDEFFPVYYSKVKTIVYLSPACITREIYEKKMSTLLGKYAPCSDKTSLCSACSLFGTVGKDEENKMFSSASRVRFTDMHLKEGCSAEYENVVTLKELSSPKLSNTEFYLKKPDEAAVFWTYDYYVDDNGNVKLWDAEINGRKFYWHRGNADIPREIEVTERNITVRPLAEGCRFIGRLYFDHITEEELNRLIYLVNSCESLRLDDEGYVNEKKHGYMLGSGKPLGLGSIATSVRAVEIRSITCDGRSIEWSNKPYLHYDSQKIDISKDVRKNFEILTSFEAIEQKEIIRYPKTDKDNSQVFEWFVENHKGYRYSKKEEKNIETNMPNSRMQMAFNQYMIPMSEELGKTHFTDIIKGKRPQNKADVHRTPIERIKVNPDRKKGAVWIAKYPLSDSQKKLLAEEGVEVLEEISCWPDKELLKKYADKYDTVLLPSKYSVQIENLAKRLFSKVFSSKRSGILDDGWKKIKV